MPKKKDSPGKLIDDRFNTLEDKIDKLDIKVDQIDKRLNRVEFEIIDIKVTQGQMLSTLKEISEQQKIMSTQVVNLVTTVEGIRQEVTAIGERVRQHEDKLESLT
jgi:chromosome segregation ATPase